MSNSVVDVIAYFQSHRPSSNFKRWQPDLYGVLVTHTSYLPTTAPLRQRLWHLHNGTTIPTCEVCNDAQVKWSVANNRYQQFCSSKCIAASSEVKQKLKSTMQQRYGVDYFTQHESMESKRRLTNYQKYGTPHSLSSETIRNKIKSTNTSRYGAEWGLSSDDVRDKIKQTCRKRYGVEFHSQKHMVDSMQRLTDCNWLLHQYVDLRKTAQAIADELGVDDSTVNVYLKNHNIAIKRFDRFSYRCIQWLLSLNNPNIQHALNGGEYNLPGTRYKVDGYDPLTNTVYEFHGDIYHGNPQVFCKDAQCHPYSVLTAGQLYEKTLQREMNIRAMGYNLVTMWEYDWMLTCK